MSSVTARRLCSTISREYGGNDEAFSSGTIGDPPSGCHDRNLFRQLGFSESEYLRLKSTS